MEKIFKKSLALVLSAALCLTALVGCLTVSAADETTNPIYEMVGAEGKAGETVTVTAKLQNIEGICAHHVKFTFAKELTVKSMYDVTRDKPVKFDTDVAEGENFQFKKSIDKDTGVTTVEDVNILNFVKSDNTYDEYTPSLELTFTVEIADGTADGNYAVNVTATAADQGEAWVETIDFRPANVVVKNTVVPDHTYADAWSYDETDHWHACTVEDHTDVADKAAHEWNDGEITTEPTLTTKGVKTFTCDVCKATKTEDVDMVAMQLSNYEYNHKNSAFNFRYTYGTDFKSIISAAKGYTDRKTEVILTLGGKEYSFETRVKSWDDLQLSGLTLNDLNSDIDLKLRLSYTKDGSICVFDTESYIINIAGLIEQKYTNGQITDEAELAVAKAYLDLNNMIKSNTEKIDAVFTANNDQPTYVTSFSNGKVVLSNSSLEFRYTHSDAFISAISASKNKNRTIFVVLEIDGKEYSFETRAKTWDDLSLSGLTLADYNSEIKMFIRLKYTENDSDVFVDSSSSTIKISDEIAKDNTTDFAKAFNAYNSLLK